MNVQPTEILWQRGAQMAATFHRHQLRRDGATPYIAHPLRVALTIAQVFHERDDTVLAAALLHDVLEDTTCDYDDIEAVCGAEVASIVAALTKDKRIPEDQREEAYARQIAVSDWRARMIKLADVYDNLSDAAATNCGVNVWGRACDAIAASRAEPRLEKAVAAVESLMEKLQDKRPMLDKSLRK